MPLLGTSPRNIVEFHRIACCPTSHDVSFRSALVNVVDSHSIADKLWWGGWALLYLRNPVGGIQRVVPLPLGLELDDLGLSPLEVLSPEISLVLDESNMQSARARPIDVPVRVRELRLVHLLGAM